MEIIGSILERYPMKWIKRASLITLSQIISQGLGFIFLVVLTWFFAENEYGEIRYVIVMGQLASAVILAGYPTALSYYIAKNRGNRTEVNRYYTNSVLPLLVLFMITFFLLFLVLGFNVGPPLVLLGIVPANLYLAVLRGFLDYKKIALFSVSYSVFKLFFLLLLIYLLGLKFVLVAVVVYAFSGLLALAIISAISPMKIGIHRGLISKETMKKITKYSIPVMIYAISITYTASFITIIINHYWSSAGVATYSVAETLILIYSFVPMAIGLLLLPKISEMDNIRNSLSYLKKSLIVSLATSALILVVSLFFGRLVISLMFPSSYADSFEPFIILSIGYLFAQTTSLLTVFWQGIDRPSIPAIGSLIGAAVATVAAFAFIPTYGIIGGACVYLASYIAFTLVNVAYLLWSREMLKSG